MVLGYDCFRISGFLLGRTDPSHDGICARGSYRPSGFAKALPGLLAALAAVARAQQHADENWSAG